MAKAKRKVDLSGVKQLAITHGEKAALAVCGLLGVIFVLVALITVLIFGAVYPEINKHKQALTTKINTTKPPDDQVAKVKETVSADPWDVERDVERFAGPPLFDPGSLGNNKLSNPTVAVIAQKIQMEKDKKLEKVDNFQLNVVRGPVEVHRLLSEGKTISALFTVTEATENATKTQGEPAKYVKARQMVLVQATFPYKQQLEIMRKALRKRTLKDLLKDKDFLPQFIGLTVIRCEVDAKGFPITSTKIELYKPNPDPERPDKVLMTKNLQTLFTESVFDEENYAALEPYLLTGLATPLPKLAYGSYPEPKFPGIKMGKKSTIVAGGTGAVPPAMPPSGGIKPPPGGSGIMPPPPGGTTPGAKGKEGGGSLGELPLEDLHKSKPFLAYRLEGKYDPFDPLGRIDLSKLDKSKTKDKDKDKDSGEGGDDTGVLPPGGNNPPIPPGTNPGGNTIVPPGSLDFGKKIPLSGKIPENVLVRFLDVDVVPGKSYTYWLQVRLANPNFGKANQVMYEDLARIREIPNLNWLRTGSVTVPPDIEYYLVDLPKRVLGNDPNTQSANQDRIAVMMQRWIESLGEDVVGNNKDFGDWAVADRLIIYRGEPIGRKRVVLHMPQWDEKKEEFKPAFIDVKDKKREDPFAIPVNFLMAPRPPVLVDFKGGKIYATSETSSVEALILTPEGKLIVRTSRQDADDRPRPQDTQPNRAQQWNSRFTEWLRRQQLLSGSQKGPANPMPPGGGAGGGGGS